MSIFFDKYLNIRSIIDIFIVILRMIVNPRTGRKIKVNGSTYKTLINEGFRLKDDKLCIFNEHLKWLNTDILLKINEFVADFYNLFNLHKTCRKFFYHNFDNVHCDNFMMKINIGTITNLVCYNCEDVGNIPKLINLTHLDCGPNVSTFIDEDLLLFTKLIHLKCGSNYQFSDNSLNKLVNLTYLKCGSYFNHFTDVALLNLHNLTYLNCENNRMFTDDSIKYLTKLTYLNCGDNKNITDESIKHLPNLTYLGCGKSNFTVNTLTHLTHLDCSNTYYFNDLNMMQLTKLTYLRCGTNKDITNETLKHLPNLTYLNCGYSIFTNQGLKYVPNLTHLSCGISSFTCYGIMQLSNLTELYRGENDSFGYDIIKYMPRLKDHIHIYNVKDEDNYIC